MTSFPPEREISGTFDFMSMEQKRGAPPSPLDDIFSFGMTMLELMPSNAPKSLRDIALRAASKDARRRYQTVGEVAKALEGWMFAQGAKRRRLWWRLAGYAVVLLMIVPLYGVLYRWNGEHENVARLNRAHASYMVKDYKGARACMMAALKVDPTSRAALISLRAIGDADNSDCE